MIKYVWHLIQNQIIYIYIFAYIYEHLWLDKIQSYYVILIYVYIYVIIYLLVGGFNPSEKYESQLGWLFPIYGKIKNVPNHQPV